MLKFLFYGAVYDLIVLLSEAWSKRRVAFMNDTVLLSIVAGPLGSELLRSVKDIQRDMPLSV